MWRTRFPARWIHFWWAMPWFLACSVGAASVTIQQVEPTPLFPILAAGQPLRQQARLCLDNSGSAFAGRAMIQVGDTPLYDEDLGQIVPGKSTNTIYILDTPAPTRVTIEVFDKATGQSLAKQELTWQFQRKWNIFCISYCHQDLGYGNYPHRIRTEIRHANIERPLKFCDETDGWDEDSKFRFVIESSEPITSFLGSHSAADAEQLARRLREGRIQVGACLATVNTEQLNDELMARLFYLGGRHTPDLLGVPRGRTALIDDVIGLTWPFATALKDAGVPYFFHGYNGCGHCEKPAELEPVFYWQGPDQDEKAKVLERATPYGGYAGDSLGDGSPAWIENVVKTLGKNWPYNTLLLQEGTDFQLVTRDKANLIHNWNSHYSYPHLVCATVDMFFDAIAAQAKSDHIAIETYAKDSNDEWADENGTDAWLLGHARKLGDAIPVAEKFATIAGAVAGGSYDWVDLYQAYHRLLLYHEHTDAIDSIAPQHERMRQYETEQVEDREMVTEGEGFCRQALEGALNKLTALITTKSDHTLIVFNPLPYARTDVVRFDSKGLDTTFQITDTSSNEMVPHQILPDGNCIFAAKDVPATGYRSYSLLPGPASAMGAVTVKGNQMESQFYRLTFNEHNGALVSIWDKELGLELVDQSAPHQFNEYLYERIEKSGPSSASVWYRTQSAQLSATSGPVADLMTVTSAPQGVDSLTQTILLYHNLKRIDFGIDMIKSPSGRKSRMSNMNLVDKESAYVALPLAVPDLHFKHELPGGVAEPIRDQFDGSCTAFYAVEHFSDVSNDRFGVTTSPVESSLVEYGYPRSCPLVGGQEHLFERVMRYPSTSRIYLYLLNNMFDVNIRWDQPGPMHFSWSLSSHAGNWQQGKADQFGREVHNPFLTRHVTGQKGGTLPASYSFMNIDAPNIVCTTIKPAEANGTGYILRFHETQGKEIAATVSLPFLPQAISAATETDTVENDLHHPLAVQEDTKVSLSLRPFGTKTIRVSCAPKEPAASIQGLTTAAISDMQVKLSWQPQTRISHYRIYRGATPEFEISPLHLVGRCADSEWVDQPQLNYGGWINNRLEPKTTYYYRIAPVDQANNEGPICAPVAATTLDPKEKNMVPLQVQCLHAVMVSPLAPFNFVNLLFRTSCESDVKTYEIHRSTQPGFQPDDTTRIGWAEADAIIKGSQAYGHVPMDYRAGDYDHMMYEDSDVQPRTTYYYRVRAVDTAGQKGPFSAEASVLTGSEPPPPIKATASSVYAPEYGAQGAVDGSPDPFTGWVSQPYGGGTKAAPKDTWLEVELPRPLSLSGVIVVGDDRPEIPLQKMFRVDTRDASGWSTAVAVTNATSKTVRCQWGKPKTTEAIRIYVPASDLPKSGKDGIPDGVVRVAELMVILPDGSELVIPDLPEIKH
jgi:hypothetical protein